MGRPFALTATRPFVVTALCAFAFALNPDLAISQQPSAPVEHSSRDFAVKAQTENQQVMSQSWGVQQGAPPDIQAIAQTTDGFLWLGCTGGLFRFDGTRFERFRPSSGERLLSSNVYALFAPPTGGLWVGYFFGGFSFVKNGRVTNYGGLTASSSGTVYTLAQDSKGTMWAGTGSGVWRLDGSKWEQLGTEWGVPKTLSTVGIDRTDTIWVISGFSNDQMLLDLLPGSKRFQLAIPKLDVYGFTLDADHKVLTSPAAPKLTSDLKNVPSSNLRASPVFGAKFQQIIDRTNSVWTINEAGELTRIGVAPRVKHAIAGGKIRKAEAYDSPRKRMQAAVDREGNVWFADGAGLHRFFYVPFHEQALPVKKSAAIVADDHGAVWIAYWSSGTSNKLYRVKNGQIEALDFRDRIDWGVAYRANDQTFWFGGSDGLWHLSHGKLLQVALPKEVAGNAFYLQAITEDRTGALWISFARYGLFRFANGVWTSFSQRENLPRAGPLAEFTDSLGRIWFGYSGFTKVRLAMLDGDKVRTFSSSDGAPMGNLTAISERGPDVWIGGEFGLYHFDGSRFHAIHAVDDDWLLGISGIVQRANGDLWLNGASGIFHISQSEIADALRDPSWRVQGEHFGGREGLPGIANQMRPIPTAIEGSDGRLWFSETSGVVWLDPNRAQDHAIVPPIAIQSVSADDKTYKADLPLTFPAHTSIVEISYSAISLSDPDAVRSRVRLHTTETDWNEVTTSGPVVYRNLSPGHYHFSVEASDTDGVWSGKVANLDFTILPAWYQTNWFYILCALAFLALLWVVYQLRLRQVKLQFATGLEERVNERTRIARELHDTLLQSFQGAVFQFQTARRLLLRNADNAMQVIDEAIHAAEEGIAEGRTAIHDLRPEQAAQRELSELLKAAAHESASAQKLDGPRPRFSVIVEGKQQALPPMVQDEVYRIAREVIRNAFAHAAASRIELEIRYDPDQLRVRIRDDGKGIDPKILQDGGQPGHFGIPGMRERAQRMGAHLDFWSEMGSGTEVEFTVPASLAYQKRRDSHRFQIFRKAGSDEERPGH